MTGLESSSWISGTAHARESRALYSVRGALTSPNQTARSREKPSPEIKSLPPAAPPGLICAITGNGVIGLEVVGSCGRLLLAVKGELNIVSPVTNGEGVQKV